MGVVEAGRWKFLQSGDCMSRHGTAEVAEPDVPGTVLGSQISKTLIMRNKMHNQMTVI